MGGRVVAGKPPASPPDGSSGTVFIRWARAGAIRQLAEALASNSLNSHAPQHPTISFAINYMIYFHQTKRCILCHAARPKRRIGQWLGRKPNGVRYGLQASTRSDILAQASGSSGGYPLPAGGAAGRNRSHARPVIMQNCQSDKAVSLHFSETR